MDTSGSIIGGHMSCIEFETDAVRLRLNEAELGLMILLK